MSRLYGRGLRDGGGGGRFAIEKRAQSRRQKRMEYIMEGEKSGRRCSRLEGDAVEVRVRVLDHELLDGPPGRSGVGDVVAHAFRHPRV